MLHSFNVAKTRSLNESSHNDYVLNGAKRSIDLAGLLEVNDVYKYAPFYMNGHCEKLPGEEIVVHSLLRKQGIWSGSESDAR